MVEVESKYDNLPDGWIVKYRPDGSALSMPPEGGGYVITQESPNRDGSYSVECVYVGSNGIPIRKVEVLSDWPPYHDAVVTREFYRNKIEPYLKVIL